jgi:hypothetical protein
MTAVQRAAKDDIEDAKGAPVRLTPWVFFFCCLSFSSLIPLLFNYIFVIY